MSRDKELIEARRKEQSQKYDLRKNRISFKDFQQSYEEHIQTQKQKRKSQQESLNKISSKNIRLVQESNRQNDLNEFNQTKKNFNDQIQNQDIKLSIQKEQNTFNHIPNIKSCFTSPKATPLNVMKSINLASNKSKQLLGGGQNNKENLSNKKVNERSYGQSKRNNVAINLNVKPNSQNVVGKVSKNEKTEEMSKTHSNRFSKNPSMSKMNTMELFEGSVNSCNQYFEPNQVFLQHVSYLATQLQFLNQLLKEIQPSSQKSQTDTSNFPYKIKLLCQIKNKLGKYHIATVDERNPLKQLLLNIIHLLQNYENDLKKLSTPINQIQVNTKPKALQIAINDENINSIEYENRFKRQDSKKKTVKLSRSRRTNEQTLYTESVVHPFEPSQFSILNASKITDNSRPSSQNKEKSEYYNEIENIINSKMVNNSIEKKSQNVSPNVVKDQIQSKMKVLIKGGSKVLANLSMKGIPIKGMQNKSNILMPEIQSKTKVNSITKTINLITNSKPSVINQSSQERNQLDRNQKNYSIEKKQVIQKNRQKAFSQQESKPHKPHSQNNEIFNKNIIPEIRQSFGSHNESIFQLEYLENYQTQDRSHNETVNLALNKMFAQTGGSNINWKQNNKYSSKLFM